MPISLFLDRLTVFRLRFLEVASAWDRLLSLESVLIRRARGAFLVGWFGPGLPVSGEAVSISLTAGNFSLLKRKIQIVVRNMMLGPNLMEPLAGLAGSLIGPVIGGFGFLIGALFSCTSVVLVVLAALGGGALLASFALVGSPTLEAYYRVTVAAALLIPTLTEFWRVVSGPRNQVRNPVLHAMLDVLDRLTPLVAHLTGAIAMVLERFVPHLMVLLVTLPAFAALMQAGFDTLQAIWKDLTDRLQSFFEGPGSPQKVFANLERSILGLFDLLGAQFGRISQAMKSAFHDVRTGIAYAWNDWLARIGPAIQGAIDSTNVMSRWTANIHRLYDMLSSSGGGPSSGPSTSDKLAKYYRKAQAILPLPPLPSMTSVPDLSDVARMAGGAPTAGFGDAATIARELVNMRRRGEMPDFDAMLDLTSRAPNASGQLPTVFDMSADDRRRIDEMVRPRSLLAAERARLNREAGGDAGRELARRWQQEHDARDRLWSIIDRMLPAAAAGYFQQLEPMLERMDKELYENIYPGRRGRRRADAERGARVNYPVLDLREDDRLRLEVGRAKVVYRGRRQSVPRPALASFGSALRAALYGNEYLAHAAS